MKSTQKGFNLALCLIVLNVNCTHQSITKQIPVRNYAVYSELPLNAIKPNGWLRHFLQNQNSGLTRFLNDVYPNNVGAWSQPKLDSLRKPNPITWPFEQTAYLTDGQFSCGYLLNDTSLITMALKKINYTLDHPDSTGYMGSAQIRDKRWPHSVFFRALKNYYQVSKDKKVLLRLSNHFLNEKYPHSNDIRESINIESIVWLYSETGDTALLNYAEEIYNLVDKKKFIYEPFERVETGAADFLNGKPSNTHGVTYFERAKLGAILFAATGKQKYLQPSIAAFEKIDKYHMMVDGIPATSENLRSPIPSELHETCVIGDFCWSAGYVLMATGNANYADKIERAMFNAAPGAITADFKTVQYFSGPNQTVATNASCHSVFFGGGSYMQYMPSPHTECCPTNLNRFMPNYISRLWMLDNNGGIVAAMYGPSELHYVAGENSDSVTITEQTQYPFDDNIEFVVNTHKKEFIAFPLTIRIPAWCSKPSITINGAAINEHLTPGSYITINRKFKNQDRIVAAFPQEIKTTKWDRNGIAVERGPLVYALKIDQNFEIDSSEKVSTPDFPAYNIYPVSPWNYALNINETIPGNIQLVKKPITDNPWIQKNAPFELRVPAYRVLGWDLVRTNHFSTEIWGDGLDSSGQKVWMHYDKYTVKGQMIFTPAIPVGAGFRERLSTTEDMVTLIPYGCTQLRITIFPNANTAL